MRVIAFVGVAEYAIRQSGILGGRHDAGREHRCFALAALFAHVASCFDPRRQLRAGDDRGDGIEQMYFGALRHLPRQTFFDGGTDIRA